MGHICNGCMDIENGYYLEWQYEGMGYVVPTPAGSPDHSSDQFVDLLQWCSGGSGSVELQSLTGCQQLYGQNLLHMGHHTVIRRERDRTRPSIALMLHAACA